MAASGAPSSMSLTSNYSSSVSVEAGANDDIELEDYDWETLLWCPPDTVSQTIECPRLVTRYMVTSSLRFTVFVPSKACDSTLIRLQYDDTTMHSTMTEVIEITIWVRFDCDTTTTWLRRKIDVIFCLRRMASNRSRRTRYIVVGS